MIVSSRHTEISGDLVIVSSRHTEISGDLVIVI